jgi:hypothetical protein|tara:strand:- start:1294 stop:1557 length:264 start_codon:yes stop_codon:yes gene_type:complete
MTETTYNVLTGLIYILIILLASWSSWKKGEKEGSVFMLEYLRENKFFNDTDYNNFMKHIRTEKHIKDAAEVSPQDLKKNDKDISNKD